MRLGVTGHQNLGAPDDANWVRLQLELLLSKLGSDTTIVSCLAAGADQLVAQLAIKHGMDLYAVLPFQEIRRTFAPESLVLFEKLLLDARFIEVLPTQENDEESYLAAGLRVVELCDKLVAVWNGLPAKGKGGTADIVEHSRGRMQVFWINPLDRTVTII